MVIFDFIGIDKDKCAEVVADKARYYRSYPIFKYRHGVVTKKRYIDAPQGELKELQEKILYKFFYKFNAHDIAHGFVKGRSPKTAAEQHVGKDFLICMDITNFFWTIKKDRVGRLLKYLAKKAGVVASDDDIALLAEVLTYRQSVPQGAPTSPVLSNLICLKLDSDLATLTASKSAKVTVTRYADDIAISGTLDVSIRYLITRAAYFIKSNGFKVNRRKTRVRKRNRPMVVLGVVVNDALQVPKKKHKNLRARLHNLIKSGKSISEEEYMELRGKVEWIKSLHQKRGSELLTQLGKIPLSKP